MKLKFVILSLLLCVAINANAAQYDWTGAEKDGAWSTPGNWSVTGSTFSWPHEEFGAGQEYINSDASAINIGNGHTVLRDDDDDLTVDGASCILTISNGSTLTIQDDMWVGDDGGSTGQVDVLSGGTLDVGWSLKVGDDGLGTLNVTDGTVNTAVHLVIGNRGTGTGYLNIAGNSTINVGDKLYLNDSGGSGHRSYVVMDGGVFNVAGNSYFNDDAGPDAEAHFTMNGGVFNGGGVIDVSWNLDGLSHLTVNGGEMIAADVIRLGVSGGDDTGESRIFLNGGVLQGEGLEFNMGDSKIVYVDGELRINGVAVSVAGMQDLVDTGKIDVSGASGYAILTDGDYTVLVPEPTTLVLLGLGGFGLIRRKRSR